ncbi:MAG: OmpA family protein [Ilumatobacteraceae bacterium]
MTNATDSRGRRSGRWIVLGGALALGGLYAAGALVQVPRVEADLGTRVERRLSAEGMAVRAAFSGQDGTLRCAAPLPDVAAAVSSAKEVWGVRTVVADASCGAGSVAPDPDTTTTLAAATTTTTGVATTTTAPSTTTVPPNTVPPTTVVAPPVLAVRLENGRLTVTGVVNNDLEHFALVQRALAAAPGNVTDLVTVDPQAAALPADRFDGLLQLLALMPVNLVAGELGWNGDTLSVQGTYAAEASRAALGAAAARIGVGAALTERAVATADQAAALEAELNALVAAEPILFDKGSSTISLSSLGTVQKVAGIAKRYAGVFIEVQGHTDSEGNAARNLTLSEQRAAAVRDALVGQGVPAADLTAKGFGMTQLITDATGRELPDKSRRVVFGVTIR